MRYGGGGAYTGVLVALVALWAVLQSLRKENSVFSPDQRKLLWFLTGLMGVSLLLSFGRFAPFYQLFYALPYASTIRNPGKFLHVFQWVLLIIFAHGVYGLSRRYLEVPAVATRDLVSQLQSWWAKVFALRPEVGARFGARLGGQFARLADLRLRPWPPGGLSASCSVR